MDKTQITNTISLELDNKLNKLKVFLSSLNTLKKYSSLEISSFLYPYSNKLNSNSFKILPFEEYIEDLHKGKRSSYKIIDDFADKFFGIILGAAIFIAFAIINPEELISVESIISIFGAYAIGKEIWKDLDNFLISVTQNLRLSWKEKKYFYSRVDFGTIEKFWELARNIKHKNKTLLPSQIDFIEHSNSKSIEMIFNKKDLKKINSDSIQILSFELNNDAFDSFKEESFMVAFKMVFNRNFLFLTYSKEYFWAESRGEKGIIETDKFIKGKILSRSILNIGRIKIYLASKINKI